MQYTKKIYKEIKAQEVGVNSPNMLRRIIGHPIFAKTVAKGGGILTTYTVNKLLNYLPGNSPVNNIPPLLVYSMYVENGVSKLFEYTHKVIDYFMKLIGVTRDSSFVDLETQSSIYLQPISEHIKKLQNEVQSKNELKVVQEGLSRNKDLFKSLFQQQNMTLYPQNKEVLKNNVIAKASIKLPQYDKDAEPQKSKGFFGFFK